MEGQFGENDQNLHENYKINICGAKHWGDGGGGGGGDGGQAICLGSGSPSH